MVELGVGPAPLPFGKLTVEGLAAAIDAAVKDGEMRQRARALGERIVAEDGLGTAVEAVEGLRGSGWRAEFETAARAAASRDQIPSLADQARDGAIAALQGETEWDPLLTRIEEVAGQAAEGEEPGSPWDELAQYLRAVVALLREEPVPPVPAAYAAHLAAIQAAGQDR
jgi:hypothetical protein